jgi:hypothetical protein
MKKKANPGEIARAKREKGRVKDTFEGVDEVLGLGDIALIHLAGAVGLRISVASGMKGVAEELLKNAGILVPYTVREK